MKKLTALLAVAVTLLSNASAVFATGNVYGPYNPYEHEPIPTGFEDTSIFLHWSSNYIYNRNGNSFYS